MFIKSLDSPAISKTEFKHLELASKMLSSPSSKFVSSTNKFLSKIYTRS